MNRRQFSKTVGLGVLGAGASPLFGTSIAAGTPVVATVSKNDRKEWARQHFKGMENFVLPSFSPDLKELDEQGIRNDVRHAIRQGFGATTSTALGMTRAERKRMLEIIADEARGKILVGGTMGGSTFDEKVEAFKHAESIGVSQTLFSLDPALKTEDELYAAAKALIDSTSLGIVLYAQPHDAFLKLDPSGIPVNVLDRLANLPNVMAVKLTQVINLAAAYQIAERLSDRVLIGVVHMDTVPLLANKYHLQWSGEWAVDAVQSPEKRYAAEFLDLVSQRRMDQAMKVYWAMQPAYQAFYDLQGPTLLVGGHPWSHIKYYQWLTGGNGGVLRDLKQRPDQVPTLDAKGRKAVRAALVRVGIKPVDLPDEAFAVGNAAYAKGVKPTDLVGTPQYSA
jgi:4-hydroxy-tetrahydrodipicolinate synthase